MKRRGKIIPFPGARRTTPAESEPFVEVHRGPHAEAVVVRGLLESEGIPTGVRSSVTHTVHPFTVGDQGTVVIVVPARAAERSRRLLDRFRSRRRLG